MAEHSNKDFEHELEESFRRFDESIRIPEIPDAQSIFERAENEKPKILPFKKYSKIIAAAAAVVLICVGVPIFAEVLSVDLSAESEPQAPMLMSEIFDSVRSDSKTNETVMEEAESFVEAEMPEIPAEPETIPETEEEETSESDFRYALENFFLEFSSANGPVDGASGINEQKEHFSSSSSSEAVDNFDLLKEKLNKKRSIEIAVEEDSVSVVLFDSSAGEEIISAFWVEGKYESSFLDGETYVINLIKTVTEEEFKSGFFVPMAGDAENGTYTIPEENIIVSGEVTRGIISLAVEIDIGTGEYKIYASLV